MQRSSAFQIGTILLATVMLAVPVAAQDCVEPPPGLVSWWPGDRSADDIVGEHPATLVGGVTFPVGKVDETFHFDGSSGYAYITSPNFEISPGGSFTVDYWFRTSAYRTKPTNFVTHYGPSKPANWFTSGITTRASAAGCPVTGDNHAFVGIHDDVGTQIAVCTSTPMNDGIFHHVAAVYDGSTKTLSGYFDGEPGGLIGGGVGGGPGRVQNLDLGPLDWSQALYFANHLNRLEVDEIDEIEIFNRALDEVEIRAIFDAGSAGKCKPPPPPTPEELLQRIEDLEAAVDELSDHTHTYRTGRGRGQYNTEVETGPAEEPSDDPNPPMTPLGAGFRVRPLSR